MSAWLKLRFPFIMGVVLTTALLPASAVLRADGGGADDEGDGGDTEHIKPDEKPKEDKRDKTDPSDIRNVIDTTASFIRDKLKITRGKKDGLWQEMVSKPYLDQVPLLKAEKLLFHGQYVEAEKLYGKLLSGGEGAAKLTDDEKRQAIEGRLEAIFRQAKLKNIERFSEGVAALPEEQQRSPRLVELRGEALVLTGRLSEAHRLLKTFTDATAVPKAESPGAGAVLAVYNLYGGVLETEAQYPTAVLVYEKVAKLALEKLPEDPAVQTQVAVAIYRHATLTSAAKDRAQDVKRRLESVVKLDRAYWPAHLALARIFLAAHNARDGGGEVNATLDLNPNNLEARHLALNWAIETYNFDAATQQLAELKDLSDLAEVYAGEGRLILKQRQPDKALPPLLEAVKRNGNLPEARGWLAAAYMLNNDPHKADEQLTAARNDEGTVHPVALYEAAEVLRDARQFKAAEKLYQQANAGATWWSEPLAGLGQLYLETGQEDKAKTVLDGSFKLDPFNMRALNQLRLLDIIANKDNFKTKETPNFIIRYSPEDQILADLAGEWLEKIYPEVTGYFHTKLEQKTIIEFFPSHEQFGVRTTGLPWIGTVGACTGNVIAMDVPRGNAKGMMGAFDWARVLRHEFTHTVTLAMTDNRIPHWLTEACAVSQEEAPRDWDSAQLLCSNYRAGTLFKLQDLNWGFIRPKRSIDRQLAYMESQWVYEYLVETYGHQKMLDFLGAFHEGKTEAQAYPAVYGKSMDKINEAFMAWAGKQIESWGLPNDPLPKREEAEKAVKDKPEDVNAKCSLAWLMLTAGRRDELARAEKLLRDGLKTDPKHVRARELLGVILNLKKEREEARTMLAGVVKDDPKRPVALRTLGLMAMADKNFDDAQKWFEQLQGVRPLEDTSYTNLAGIYLLRKEPGKAIAELRVLQAHEQKDERIARKLAELLRAQKDYKEAESMAYKAIRINPYNAVNHQLMARILVDENLPARAIPFWRHTTELQPQIADFWAGLAEALGVTGDAQGAAAAARKAAELSAETPAKKWIKP